MHDTTMREVRMISFCRKLGRSGIDLPDVVPGDLTVGKTKLGSRKSDIGGPMLQRPSQVGFPRRSHDASFVRKSAAGASLGREPPSRLRAALCG